MTTEREPPRLRTLHGELPPELDLALAASPEDEATPDELAEFAARLLNDLNAREREVARLRFGRRKRAPSARIASLVLMFALGAGAGVLVSGGVFVVARSRALEASKSEEPAARNEMKRTTPRAPRALPAAPSAAPEPAEGPLAPPPAPSHDPARFPAQNPGADLPSEAPSAANGADRDEFALIARAQSALATNPGLALALTSDHERKFPHGALGQEREVIAIDALLRLGRRSEATNRALRFHREFPMSVHGHRLDVLLGGGTTNVDHN